MSEICKTCHKRFNSGIWLSPQFPDEKVLLFCSDRCKHAYINMKIHRIKVAYPAYYNKIVTSSESQNDIFWLEKEKIEKKKIIK